MTPLLQLQLPLVVERYRGEKAIPDMDKVVIIICHYIITTTTTIIYASLSLGEMAGAPPDERAPAHGGSQAKTQARKRYAALPVYRWYGTYLSHFFHIHDHDKTTIFKIQMIIV